MEPRSCRLLQKLRLLDGAAAKRAQSGTFEGSRLLVYSMCSGPFSEDCRFGFFVVDFQTRTGQARLHDHWSDYFDYRHSASISGLTVASQT